MSDIIGRKVLPLAGHKSEGMRTCHVVYCECGWTSCPHWERGQAWGEWREHILSHGAEREPWDKARARHDREQKRLRDRYSTPAPADLNLEFDGPRAASDEQRKSEGGGS